jgi:hypothetical protein
MNLTVLSFKDYMLYDSIYMTFSEDKIIQTQNRSVIARCWGEGLATQEKLYGDELPCSDCGAEYPFCICGKTHLHLHQYSQLYQVLI